MAGKGHITIADLAFINPRSAKASLNEDDLVSFIPMSAVDERGQWVEPITKTFSEVKSGYTQFQENDVLFAKITPCAENGKGTHAVGLTNGFGCGSTEFHVLRPKPGVNARYLFQITQLETARLRAANMMTGSAGQKRVPTDFFEVFPLTKRNTEEQNHIANLFDSIDAAIEKNRDLSDQHKRVKKAYLEEQFFGSKISFRPLKSYLSAPIKNGVSVNDTEDKQGDIILALGAVTKEGFNPMATKTTPPALALQSNAQLTSGDIVVSRSNTPNLVGLAGLYEGIPSACYYPDLLMRVRIDPKRAHPKFIEQAILSNHGRQYMHRMSKGTSGSMKKIDKVILEDFPVIDMPLDHQKALVRSIRIFEERAASLLSTLNSFKRLKTALSQQIFN